MKYRLFYLSAFAALSFSVVSQAGAVTIYAMDNISAGNDTLITFDSATPGSVTVLGNSSHAGLFGGLDFAGVGGGLFAWNQTAGTAGLYSVNPTNGATTFIGAGGTGLLSGDNIRDLSWNPVTNTMLGVAGGTTVGDRLYSIDLATGNVTNLGTITGNGAAPVSVGLSTNAAGVSFIHELVTDTMYSLAGTVATPLAPEGFLANFSQGMVIDWSGSGTWYHGAVRNSPSNFSELYTVAPTGVGTLVGLIGPGPISHETGDIAINPVPEPATMAVLSIGALALLRRRRK